MTATSGLERDAQAGGGDSRGHGEGQAPGRSRGGSGAPGDAAPGQAARAGIVERSATEVSLADLGRRGVERVKVMRAAELDRMIQRAAREALAAAAQDRDRLMAESRRAIEDHRAEAAGHVAAARRAEEVIEGLRRKTARLGLTAGELRERLRGLEEGIGRRRQECAGLEREGARAASSLARAEGLRDERRAARAALEQTNQELRARLQRAEEDMVKLREGNAKLERDNRALERGSERLEAPDAKPAGHAAVATGRGVEPSGRKREDEELGKGLDVGTANLISAVQDRSGNLYVGAQRNAFIEIEQDSITKSMLDRQGVQYVVMSGRMVVVGDPAFELANVFNRETRRPMARGVLSPDEDDALPIMKLLIEKLLGPPKKEGEICYFSVPADPIDFRMNAIFHEKMFHGVLTRLGYDARAQNEGHAVVLAELADDDFTGIGISCGGGMHNVCVSYKAVNVVSFATARGGDWIDENVAQVLGVKKSKATAIKERGVDLRNPKNREEQAVEIYYRDLIQYTLKNIKERFESKADRPDFKDPVDMVFAGGTSMVGGFTEVVKEELAKVKFPIPIKNVRRADDPLHSVAKGCLVAAMSGLDL